MGKQTLEGLDFQMTDRERKLDKLRKLLALATNNPNKAEALAAIAKLHKRATEFGLTLDQIKSSAAATNDYGSRSEYSGEKQFGYVDRFLWRAIAAFCCCKVGVGRDADGDLTIVYFGHEVDVELAFWLRGTIRSAMAFEWGIYRDFVLPKGADLTTAMRSFHEGLAGEMINRMEAVDRGTPTTGRDLIVAKQALVETKAAEAGFQEAKGGRSYARKVDSAAFGAGASAGRRIDIGRGVSGRTSSTRMIGK